MEREGPKRQVKCAIFGNPGTLNPFELSDIISDGNIKSVVIKGENSSVVIPNGTIEKIVSMKDKRTKAFLMTKILKAVQDATELKLDYETNSSPISGDNFVKPEVSLGRE